MSLKTAVLLPAAGSSRRFKGKKKKQFMDIDGRAVFLRTAELFAERDDVAQIVMAIPAEDEELFTIKWGASVGFHGIKVIIGADERFQTVQKLLGELKDDVDMVALHDAVRPCVTKELIDKVFTTAGETGAAILGHRLVGTIKRAGDDGNIAETVDRSELWEAQTPQVFKKEIILKAYEQIDKVKESITDDAQLVEATGVTVQIVESEAGNIKITSNDDIAIAGAILKARESRRKPKKAMGPWEAEAQW
ncbi:MAG: 2-C-methyl-D-erythritol 4-phosphate cytidylyltransferase [Planctomycetes bacterium]|nr:2-C-methyl-D-erythritol 4-phosphate cytidylyltransferase [Planctomycetota bacterium]